MKISQAGTRTAKTGQWTALLDCRGVNDISQNFTIIVHTKESKNYTMLMLNVYLNMIGQST